MLNRVWFWLFVVGLVYGMGRAVVHPLIVDPPSTTSDVVAGDTVANGDGDSVADDPQATVATSFADVGTQLTNAMIDASRSAVEICIGLIGIMVLWLGLLQIAQDAGLVDLLARWLRPLIRWLFPGIPDGHPAQGAVLLNLSANMLGLENAATPMGLKAMHELQRLNTTPDTATNSMAMFLAINTSNVTLVPIAVIGYRAKYGSEAPAEPLFGTLVVTLLATIAAVVACRVLEQLPRYRTTIDDNSLAKES